MGNQINSSSSWNGIQRLVSVYRRALISLERGVDLALYKRRYGVYHGLNAVLVA